MKLNQKVKIIREGKKLSQSYLAHELGLDQSQYSRREKGEITFTPDEIVKLSHLLETTISNLFNQQENLPSAHAQIKDSFEQYVSTNEKLMAQYEHRLKEKDALIIYLSQKSNYHWII